MADDLKILIVDDEPIIIRSCEAILKSEGYNIEGILSAKNAILRMEQQSYDLVFTDLKMPEVDGITLIRWIKQKRPDTGIVIIPVIRHRIPLKTPLSWALSTMCRSPLLLHNCWM